jgi:ABC-2 type transport system permease protein
VQGLLAQLKIEMVLAGRRGESVLIPVVVPVVLLIFFGAVAPPAVTGNERPTDFLVPGLLALAIMSTSMVSLGIATAYERYYGALKRLLGSPLPRSGLLAAKTLSVLLIEVVQVVLITGIARFAFGWQPTGSPLAALLALAVGSAAFAGLGLLMAGSLRAEATLAVANGLYLLFLLVGGFIFPLDRLPGSMESVAKLLPAAALTDATRAALIGAPAQDLLEPLGLLAGWAVVAIGAAVLTFRAD